MQQSWPADRSAHRYATRASRRRRRLPNPFALPAALATAALSLARRRLARPQAMLPPALAGFVRGASVRLPAGEVISAEQVRHLHTELGEEVVATGSEAWVAVRMGRLSIWYAFWYADEKRWELLTV